VRVRSTLHFKCLSHDLFVLLPCPHLEGNSAINASGMLPVCFVRDPPGLYHTYPLPFSHLVNYAAADLNYWARAKSANFLEGGQDYFLDIFV